jgi:hypothetical protein
MQPAMTFAIPVAATIHGLLASGIASMSRAIVAVPIRPPAAQ